MFFEDKLGEKEKQRKNISKAHQEQSDVVWERHANGGMLRMFRGCYDKEVQGTMVLRGSWNVLNLLM